VGELAAAVSGWQPLKEPDPANEWVQRFPISAQVSFVQRLGYDEDNRLAEWAVCQCRLGDDGKWQRVAVYDTCHGTAHMHLYNQDDVEFAKRHIASIDSYESLAVQLDSAVADVQNKWRENERRSNDGR
jgi:hypothetical protein